MNQNFFVLPDPIFWQVVSTLVYEKIMKFVQGLPMTSRTQTVQSPSKVGLFYKQILETPLNYGSLQRRSCRKPTLIRQVAFGKRCILSMRGMIVPDASLRPNKIQLPAHVVKKFNIHNQWIILNRMPSLQPGNFIALR
ncbi:RPOLA_N domain-containing protein [Trichonephila clavata]|uniref:RPOLA_N domain-containing protein n=1 Tax=Trichonephila clavata TaxID=2740835 RepID=A0A8X6GFU0_TRICU|nr:RPOLA_N domain-containing protein [Trichonephila clavata]